MGMFDTYVPSPERRCPVCGGALVVWQGKDGPCDLYTWHQGTALPKEPLRFAEEQTGDLLPEKFTIYSNDCDCPYFVDAHCEATDGTWTSMEIETASGARKRYGETKAAFANRLRWLRGERRHDGTLEDDSGSRRIPVEGDGSRSRSRPVPASAIDPDEGDITKRFVIIFGPPAVGKMTVGYALSELTGLKLLHNHMTIDLVLEFFDWGTEQFKLSGEFRRRIFEEVASSDLDGLIFTFVWDLGDAGDKEYIDGICRIFEDKGAKSYFVELYAEQSERLVRNESEFRLSRKPSKRDVAASRDRLIRSDEDHVLNTEGEFCYGERYLRIDNTEMPARDVARAIVEAFDFELAEDHAHGSHP